MGVLLSELGAIYSAHCRNEAVGLPSSSQFVNYARWEKSQRERGETSESETYWLTQFKDLAPVLDLPTDRPRLAVKTYAGARERVVIPTSLCRDLRRIAARKGATLFATLLAGFYVLLQRLTGQHDIVVGIPAAGQLAFDARDLVGHCVNFLPLRSRIDESASFSNYLASIRSLLLDGYEHQNYTYGSLIQKLNILRDASHSPLVSVSFNLDKDGSAPDFADLDVEVSNQPKTAINFDCEINVLEAGDELRVSWDYNTDLFDTDTIRRWLHHYRWLLETVVTNPDQRISELPMLTEAERHQLLVAWNDTRREYPKDKCVHHLVEAQEEKTPHAVAAVFDDQNLTYRDLNARANQLAHYLIKLGVGPETLVGICMERSLDMVVGLLGILKAGGAYVPLDAAYPKERLEYMLQEGRVQILLTQQRLLSILPSDHGAQLLCLDTDWAQVAEQVDSNPDNTTTPENVAYVIYTSGSTGKPKGVKISHNAVVNFLSAMQRETGIAANDTLLAITTLSFDIAGLELYLPLTVGARVVLVSREVAWDGVLLAENLAKSGATMMQATPTTWRMLIEDGWRGGSHLKILCGGETLTPDLATQLLTRSSTLWNVYGPTETTIWSSIFRIETPNGLIPIGRPIANTQMYILDRYQQPLPIGVPGELYIGGAGLARGYLNRPDLTDEYFIANPFSNDPESRLYKTGDLARYLPDGNILFLGRIDNQVKIRGYRIELGEIESVLAQHPAIQQAVVLAREDIPGDRRLVAYTVTTDGSAPSAHDLRSFVQLKLPDYMVPSAYVFLDSLPLTPNGKLDRKVLPVPDHSRPELDDAFAAPGTPVEKILANIWAEILKLDKVGIRDNFFELGGHSLLATQVVSRIRSAFSIEFPLRQLFESPTVAEMAIIITSDQAKRASEAALEQMLREVEGMKDEEVRKQITESRMRN